MIYLKWAPNIAPMKTLFQLNKWAVQLIVLMASPMGLMGLMLLLTVFDSISNGFAIAEVFSERMVEFVKAFGVNESSTKSIALVVSFLFALFASCALSLGILVTAVQQPTDKERKNEAFEGDGNMQQACRTLGIISFAMSLIGYVVFLTKGKAITSLFTVFFIAQLGLCTMLAYFVPYLFTKLSLHMRDKYGDFTDGCVSDIFTEIHAGIMANIKGLNEEDRKEFVRQAVEKNVVRRGGNLSAYRTGTTG